MRSVHRLVRIQRRAICALLLLLRSPSPLRKKELSFFLFTIVFLVVSIGNSLVVTLSAVVDRRRGIVCRCQSGEGGVKNPPFRPHFVCPQSSLLYKRMQSRSAPIRKNDSSFLIPNSQFLIIFSRARDTPTHVIYKERKIFCYALCFFCLGKHKILWFLGGRVCKRKKI